MTMEKRTIAAALAVCTVLSATACSIRPRATVIQTMETFSSSQESSLTETSEATTAESAILETVLLKGSGDDTYSFTFDSEMITYSGQGGNFFLVGSSPTECYLHIMVQSGDTTYEDTFESAAGRIVEEYTLPSGRRAFCYKTSEANTLHVIIDAKDLVTTGNCLVKISIGSADAWPYSQSKIADMVDNGFYLEK